MDGKAMTDAKDDTPKVEAAWSTLHEDLLSRDTRITSGACLGEGMAEGMAGRAGKLYKGGRWEDPPQERAARSPAAEPPRWLRGASARMIETST